jgi:hypothetical protein
MLHEPGGFVNPLGDGRCKKQVKKLPGKSDPGAEIDDAVQNRVVI